MSIGYFDCYSGISGDMVLGALVDAGLDVDDLRGAVASLPVEGYEIRAEQVERSGVRATRVHVEVEESKDVHRTIGDIEAIIEGAKLPERVRQRSLAAFRRIAEAEAHVHRRPVESTHFHEVGCLDAIIDVTGAMAGVELMGIERVMASPLAVGEGTVRCRHGELPVPAPATLQILRDVPIYSGGVEAELTTPTGAAIITTLAESFGPLPHMRLRAIGYGAGGRDLPGRPNCLRLVLGDPSDEQAAGAESAELSAETERATLYLLETDLDDMNPELFSALIEKLFDMGALDVHWVPIQMKKNRPGVSLRVLTDLDHRDSAARLIFRETSTFGLRILPIVRYCLRRSFEWVETPFGRLRVKIGYWGDEILKVTPEYEDCRRIAEAKGLTLARVYQAAASEIERRYFRPPSSD